MRNKIFTTALMLFVQFNLSFGQTNITMQREGGVYIVPCSVNGLKLKFIFDTGASDVSISLTEALFMIKNGYLKSEDILGKQYYSIANGDIAVGTKFILREIEIAGLKLKNVEASVVHEMEAPLLLGQSAIAKLGKIQLDPSNNTLTILNGTQNTYDYSSSNAIAINDNEVEKIKFQNGFYYQYEAKADYCLLEMWTKPDRNASNAFPNITPLASKFYIIKRRMTIDGCSCWDYVYCDGHYGYTLSPWLQIEK